MGKTYVSHPVYSVTYTIRSSQQRPTRLHQRSQFLLLTTALSTGLSESVFLCSSYFRVLFCAHSLCVILSIGADCCSSVVGVYIKFHNSLSLLPPIYVFITKNIYNITIKVYNVSSDLGVTDSMNVQQTFVTEGSKHLVS